MIEASCPVCGRSAKMRPLSELVGDVRQAFKAGRKAERAAIIAELRRRAVVEAKSSMENRALNEAAAAIEAGHHLPPTNEEEGDG